MQENLRRQKYSNCCVISLMDFKKVGFIISEIYKASSVYYSELFLVGVDCELCFVSNLNVCSV